MSKKSALNKIIGKRFQNERKKRGLKQKDLAQQLGISPKTISAYENGYSALSQELAKASSDFFGVPETYFTGEDLQDKFQQFIENNISADLKTYDIPIVESIDPSTNFIKPSNIVGYEVSKNPADFAYVYKETIPFEGIKNGDLLFIDQKFEFPEATEESKQHSILPGWSPQKKSKPITLLLNPWEGSQTFRYELLNGKKKKDFVFLCEVKLIEYGSGEKIISIAFNNEEDHQDLLTLIHTPMETLSLETFLKNKVIIGKVNEIRRLF